MINNSSEIIMGAFQEFKETGDFYELKKLVETEFSLIPGKIEASFKQSESLINDVDGDLQETKTDLEKHFTFDLNGLTIKGSNETTSMQLVLDNDIISFQKNGQQFGWWDGVDFHTGNIVIDVNEKAQFGNFAFVPRSDGSLSFLKIGG
jgi:hypothetical protein